MTAVLDLGSFLDRRSCNLQGWSCRLSLFGGRHGALPPEDNKNEGASGDMYENKEARQSVTNNSGRVTVRQGSADSNNGNK